MSSSVVLLLETLDTKKSTGPDGLSALFLRKVAAEIAEPLTYIYNKSLSTGSFPDAWKQSNVTPVHKGGDADDPGNHHPISAVSIVARVLEKIIASQLSLYLESHHLINNLQGAYRHGRSADQILLYAVDKIVQAVDGGNFVCAAFLDLRKAFDSLDHHLLLDHLFSLGVIDVELQWFANYLSDRRQRVKRGNQFSEWGSVLGGIPQGSALGPLLFLIYANAMPLQVSRGCLLQFADDTCLICFGDSCVTVARSLQDDLRDLSKWIEMSKMKLNLKKSSVMWFSIKPPSGPPPPVLYDTTPLTVVDRQKYLGVIFDHCLTWSSHVAKVCNSMSYYLFLISPHVRFLPTTIVKMLMESLVFSRYTYALPVWGPAISRDCLSRLDCNGIFGPP